MLKSTIFVVVMLKKGKSAADLFQLDLKIDKILPNTTFYICESVFKSICLK